MTKEQMLEIQIKEQKDFIKDLRKEKEFMMEHLEDVLNFNKEQMSELHSMDKEDGKKLYGSLSEFKKAQSIWAGKVMQIEDLLTYFKFQLYK
jgi:hypothetical protein